MDNKIKNKLFFLLKLCIFKILATVVLPAYAEYYQVYATPEPSDLCIYCPHKTQHLAARKFHRVPAHRKAHLRPGLYVYYPGHLRPACPCNQVWTLEYCQCCPQPNRVRSRWGDYVVFSARPVDMRSGTYDEEESSYNPDLSTSDDGRADMEVN